MALYVGCGVTQARRVRITMGMLAFDNSYARLPDRFYARIAPTTVADPQLLRVNRPLAELLGVDADLLGSPALASIFSGNEIPEGAEPIALAYAGHQFGMFVPQLGDGRAVLLGEVIGKDGQRRDIQLKGAGRTPFSRGGDGRAALGPVLREYVVSEAMAALGVPTTRALAAVSTGEPVVRDELLPGAVLTRVAASHIRVGTFQFFAARRDQEALGLLAAHALARHYPAAVGSGNDALALIEQVIAAQAELIASWLGFGFVHGVMNTDNTSISGETIDYGPCAFLDEFDPHKKFSSIDHAGRYAFSNQPRMAQWNLARLAEALLGLLADDEQQAVRLATEQLERFPSRFDAAYARVLRAKLGLAREEPGDVSLAQGLLDLLAANQIDYTRFFRKLCAAAGDPAGQAGLESCFEEPAAFRAWADTWRGRLAVEDLDPAARAAAMRRANPAFIPRNHRVQEAIDAAIAGDLRPFEALVEVLARPCDDQPDFEHLAEPPRPEQRVLETFCGT